MNIEINNHLVVDSANIKEVEFESIAQKFNEYYNFWAISGVNTYWFSYQSNAKITMKNGEVHNKSFYSGFLFCVREIFDGLDYSLVIVKCEKDILSGDIRLKGDIETTARSFITPEIEDVFLQKIETEIKEFKAKLLI